MENTKESKEEQCKSVSVLSIAYTTGTQTHRHTHTHTHTYRYTHRYIVYYIENRLGAAWSVSQFVQTLFVSLYFRA